MKRFICISLTVVTSMLLLGAVVHWQGAPALISGERSVYSLPTLPYAYDALEPHLDAQTMQIHYERHHKTYVDKLNEALAKHPDVGQRPLVTLLASLDRVSDDIRAAVRNHGGGHFNHTVFWKSMTNNPEHVSMPDDLKQMIERDFGSVEKFKEEFTKVALATFGSGWAWLVAVTPERPFDPALVHSMFGDGPQPADIRSTPTLKKLAIVSTPNQDTPLAQRMYPLLGLDVWEHAYYLKYQNKRPDYVAAWWNVIDWHEVARRLASL